MSHHPAWYHNMMANPDVEVEIRGTMCRNIPGVILSASA